VLRSIAPPKKANGNCELCSQKGLKIYLAAAKLINNIISGSPANWYKTS